MSDRLTVNKTYKLYIGGAFVRSESGASTAVEDRSGAVIAHLCRASRKDLRESVEAAIAGYEKWFGMTAYNRGQVLYRMAEMLEGKAEEFSHALIETCSYTAAQARNEVGMSVDRLVGFAGWADKFQQVIGCQNPVAGPYYNFTVPQAIGVTGVIAPNDPPLLALVTMIAGPLTCGNSIVVVASEKYPLPAAIFGEVCATSDVPAGAINILTGRRADLLSHLADHRRIMAISAAGVSASMAELLRCGTAENVKRVSIYKAKKADWSQDQKWLAPWRLEEHVDAKTIWHPSAT